MAEDLDKLPYDRPRRLFVAAGRDTAYPTFGDATGHEIIGFFSLSAR